MNLADTYAFTGTVTGAGEINTPSFSANNECRQIFTIMLLTKIDFDTELFDTDNVMIIHKL